MTSKNPASIRPITPSLGEGNLKQMFSGKPFIHCLLEMIKNSRDYRAKLIAVFFQGRDRFVALDNGRGMGAKNRDGFASVNHTTATSRDQSGRFGSGTKHMLYSHATQVEVLTAPEEEPDWVYRFSFTTESYERMVLRKEQFLPERMPKTSQTWPHPFPFGTQIVYTLAEPTSRGIMRGEKLAAELASRLPLKFRDILTVDGEPLPEKKLVGRQFVLNENHSKLGPVSVELYRPERRRSDDDLRMAVVEVGETPIRNVFRLDVVCGTITVPAFRDYANEDRNTFSPRIGDDPRIMPFVRFLEQIAPSVQQALEIKLSAQSEDEADRAAMDELREMITGAYGPELVDRDGPGIDPPVDGPVDPPIEPDPISLSLRHEFEPGEEIDVKVRLHGDAAEHYTANDLQWHTTRANATNIRVLPDGLRMTANHLGRGVISVDIPGTPYGASTQYDVVAQRVFRLSSSNVSTKVSKNVMLLGVNVDRLKGKLVWKHTGVGRLDPNGARADFKSNIPGVAEVTAYGADDPRGQGGGVGGVWVIRGGRGRDAIIRIRTLRFREKTMACHSGMPPVAMSKGGNDSDSVHVLTVVSQAHGYKEARERRELPMFLALATALEYARFERLVINPDDVVDQRDVRTVQEDITSTAWEVFEELVRSKK